MRTPADGRKLPLALVAAWVLVLAMVAGYWLLVVGYHQLGLALFSIAGVALAVGSIVAIVTTISHGTGWYRGT